MVRCSGGGACAGSARPPSSPPPGVGPDEECRLEHALHGIGLVITKPGAAGLVVSAESGRCARARRRTADRWVEELLYRAAACRRCCAR